MVEKIGLPPASARKAYFVFKNPRFKNGCNEAELKIWVNKTEGFSFAHMKEVIIGVEILEKSLEEVIDKLKKMGSDMPDSKNSDKGEESRGFGFAAG
jgi:Ni,Fe-hydrogenase I large subunit